MVAVEVWKLLWATWNLRGVILFSLFLQTFLIFFAPLRKRVSTAWLTTPLWLAYLLADMTAAYGVGLISRSQGETTPDSLANRTLLAFWAPFLLVHLGGPDTITAFALEDNELWLRHSFGLVSQGLLVAYAFFQSFPNHKFWLPTLLMFISGVLKYTERTRSFYLASSRKFKASLLTKPDPGPNYVKIVAEMKSNPRPKKIEWAPESTMVNILRTSKEENKMTDLKVVQVAHQYFSVFNGLIAGSIFSFRERNLVRDFFLKRTARDAFKVVEVELNFFYEILYTKATVVHGMVGYLLRILSSSLNFATIVIFFFIAKEFKKMDVRISYSLLFGAINLDFAAWVMVFLSDWTVVALTKSNNPNWFIEILKRLRRVDRVKLKRRRWSESLSQYNLLNCCLHPRAKWLEATIGYFGLTNLLDGIEYVETVKFTNDLRDLIFDELKMKSELADTFEIAKKIFLARGDWILKQENHKDLRRWIKEVDFDESLILWHIATDLCYYTNEVDENADDGGNPTEVDENADDGGNSAEVDEYDDDGDGGNSTEVDEYDDDGDGGNPTEVDENAENAENANDAGNPTEVDENADDGGNPTEVDENADDGGNSTNLDTTNSDTTNSYTTNSDTTNSFDEDIKDYRKLSKLLSDYMLYMLIMQSTMLSDVAGIGQTRFRDTCAEAERFFREKEMMKEEKNCSPGISNFGKCFCGNVSDYCNKCNSKWEKEQDKLQQEACEAILLVDTSIEPFAVKRDRSKSVLFDACMLAKELKKLERQSMWEIISKVWVELLCYAACHCKANTHVAQLNKGGQLLTLVWLLMANLGLGDHFQIREGHATAKLIVKK